MARLGEQLVTQGLITQEALDTALASRQAEFLGTVLVRQGAIDELALARAVERESGSPYIDLEHVQLREELALIVPFTFAERRRCVPVHADEAYVYVGAVDPTDVVAWDELAQMADLAVRTFTVRESQLLAAWQKLYGDEATRPRRVIPLRNGTTGKWPRQLAKAEAQAPPPPIVPEEAFDIEKLMEALDDVEVIAEEEPDDGPGDMLVAAATDSPTVKLVNGFIYEAAEKGASDIHIEPEEHATRVRYRIDGVLKPRVELPKAKHRMIVSRVKIMAQLDISERRLPQDGRVRMRIADKSIDLRVSTVPVVHGEKIVIRVLGGSLVKDGVDRLGLRPRDLDRVRKSVSATNGMFLSTGPTGSGKTTTLYTILRELAGPGVNIVTAEDPVEYEQAGIAQLQVKPAIGLTFAHALRSFLRQDPDIIMVGEIRDLETAEISVKAALTGHLVLSTLHTNDAVWTVARLLDIGLPPFLVAAAVRCIVAQRLVRRLCPHCKVETANHSREAWERIAPDRTPPARVFAPVGCGACSGIGFKGRIPVFEVFSLEDDAVKRIVTGGADRDDLVRAAREDGMRTLIERALEHVEEGATTLEEAWACCGM